MLSILTQERNRGCFPCVSANRAGVTLVAALCVTALLFAVSPGLSAEGETQLRVEGAVGPETSRGDGTLRDPFMPGDSLMGAITPPSVDPSQLRVEAIIFHPKTPKALVSGQIVGVGDHVFDYKVTRITSDEVSLQRGNNFYALFLRLPFERD